MTPFALTFDAQRESMVPCQEGTSPCPTGRCSAFPLNKMGSAADQMQVTLAWRIAAMQHCSMTTTIPMTKRGSLTLPPSLRRKMGLDKMRNPMLLVEEREGGLFLQPAVALPIRDIPKKQIEAWIARDEAEMAAFRASAPKAKKK